ncbi:MAG: PqqD family protein [Sphingobacteriaceae bacterium]|nr:PqqD family protein [Sphingobacteriaceae bacterium]
MLEKSYIVNSQGVYSDNFDGEAVIVNLNLGNYYSVRDVASAIWSSLQLGVSLSNLADQISSHYNSDKAIVAADLLALFEHLFNDSMIVEFNDGSVSALDTSLLPAQYSAPQLETFSDLQDLFLLDPVHAVDDKLGWPIKPATK